MMKIILTIARRECSAYFTSPIAYVYLFTFLVFSTWLFFRGFFVVGQADMRAFFSLMPWIFLFFIPAVSMSKWSEERKQGTIELLLTLPIRDRDIVIGKFLGGMGLVFAALLCTLPLVITVALLGPLDWGPVIGGYVGLLFLGGAYLSIGLVVSALTENQIIAFILGIIACFLFFMLGTPLISGGRGGLVPSILQYLGIGVHFESIARGVLDSRDLIFSLSLIAFFLGVNVAVVSAKARR